MEATRPLGADAVRQHAKRSSLLVSDLLEGGVSTGGTCFLHGEQKAVREAVPQERFFLTSISSLRELQAITRCLNF